MAHIALFHSVLGLRPGVRAAAERLRAASHAVTTVDQYDGRVFDDYDAAAAHAEMIGYPILMQRALDAVAKLPDGFVAAGFSNGAGMAEYVAIQRRVAGAVLLSGALPLEMLGVEAWPAGVPVQIHYTLDDPFRRQEWIDSLVAKIRPRAHPSRYSTTRAAATCSPTRRCPPSTTQTLPRSCGSTCSPSALRSPQRECQLVRGYSAQADNGMCSGGSEPPRTACGAPAHFLIDALSPTGELLPRRHTGRRRAFLVSEPPEHVPEHVDACLERAPIERALALADLSALAALLRADPAAATTEVAGLAPLLALQRRSTGPPADLRTCARLLLDAGADPDSHTVEWGGEGRRSALFDAVERGDPELISLLLDRGATRVEDAFYHACEKSNTVLLDLLHVPGFEGMVNHKLDFEDAHGMRWFLERGVDVNAHRCLHHAICRGRCRAIIEMLLEVGADVNLPWDRWDVGRRPLALAARCGHLAAFELLRSRGATAQLDDVDAAVLAVARGESVRVPKAPPPALGNPRSDDYGWILGQFALLGRTEVVRALLDAGMAVDTRGWSNFTPLDQAAMHGRADTVRLLIERGADLDDRAFDDHGPTPLDCAIWALCNNRADDGDYAGVVKALLAAGAPTRFSPPTGDTAVDGLLGTRAADRRPR